MQDVFGLDQRQSFARWQAAAFQLGAIMTVVGLLVMLITAYKTFGAAELLGQILGALLLGSGLFAAAGSKKRNSNCVTASLTISLLSMLLAFEFITEVSREAGVDCALAELYTKSLATESTIKEQKHAEVLFKLYVRMNEMEEMMSGVETGAIKSIQLSQAQEQLKRSDQDYVQSKMRHLKQHAEGLLDSILNHPNLTEPQIYQMDAAQKEELRRRVQIADDVIDGVINKLWDTNYDGAKIYQDYEKGLQELLSVITASSPGEHFQLPQQDSSQLAQTANELQRMKQALTRSAAGEYHKLDPLGHGRELQTLQDQRARKREDFSNQFLSLLHQHEMVKHSGAFLADLPEHCVVENRNERMLVSLGLTAMLLELAATYCTLSFVMCMPRKHE
ncbi:hypothetical protein WJX79_009655 [Trebouxia sp. C0005]